MKRYTLFSFLTLLIRIPKGALSLNLWISLIGVFAVNFIHIEHGFAVDRQWNGAAGAAGAPGTIWNTGSNWIGGMPPAGTSDAGVFINTAANQFVTINNAATVGQVRFNSGALPYAFTISSPGTFTLNNAGIVNNSTNSQTFNINLGGTLTLSSASTITSGVSITSNSGTLNFSNTSSAGTAFIQNSGGTVNFNNSSSSGTNSITNTGTINFNNLSSSGTTSITNTGTINFNSTAASLGSAVITNTASSPGAINFINGSTPTTSAQNLTIINNSTGTGVDISAVSASGLSIGSLSGSGNINLGTQPLTVGSIGNTEAIFGTISGSGSTATLTKTGTGTLFFNGSTDNTYTGGTTLNGGTLAVNADGKLGNVSGGLTFGGGTLRLLTTFNSNRAVTLNTGGGTIDTNGFNSTFSGNFLPGSGGGLTKAGTGTLTLSGTPSYTGLTTISAGTLTFQGDTTGLAGNITNNVALVFDQATNSSFSKIISGTGTLTKSGAGNLTLSGTNTYSGGTTVSAGTLTGNTSSLTGNITNNAALVFNQGTDANFASNIIGTGTFTKSGAGNLTLSGTNTYSGGTFLTGGTLAVDSDARLGNGGGLTFAGGTLRLLTTFNSNRAVTLNTGGGTIDTNGFNSTFSGNFLPGSGGGLTKAGTGTLTLSGTPSYTGLTTISAGTLTFQGDTTGLAGNITNNAALVFDQAANSSFSKIISGTGTLTKSGTGILTLSGANTYTGGTFLTGGTLAVDSDARLGNGGGLTFAGGTLRLLTTFNNNRAVTLNTGGGTIDTNGFNSTFSGNFLPGTGGGLTKVGAGTLTLSGTPSYTGLTTISTGTLAFQGDTSGLTGNITNNAALVFDQAANSSFSKIISGTGTLTKSSAGILTLSGAPTYSGLTTIGGGTLTFQGDTSGLAGNITNNAALVFDQAANSSFSQVISGTGTLRKTNTGTLTLSGINDYTGATTIDNGTLVGILGSNTVSGLATALTVISPGEYHLTADQTLGSLTGSGPVLLNDLFTPFTLTTGGNNTSTSYDGSLSGTGGITKVGTGTFTLSGNSNYTGPTIINAGTVAVKSNTALGTGPLTFNGANLTLQAGVAGLSLANPITLTSAGTIDTNGNAFALGGAISGNGLLTKVGLGALTLSGNNTYTGGTSITGGTLAVGSNSALGTGTLSFNNPGTTLQAGVAGLSLANPITLTSAGTIDTNGNTLTLAAVNALSGSNGLTIASTAAGGVLSLPNANAAYSGSTTLAGGTVRIGNNSSLGTGSFAFNGASTTLQAGAAGLSLTNPITLTSAGTIDTNGNTLTLAAANALSGSNGLTITSTTGGGTLSLTNANAAYSGSTTLAGGTVRIGNNSSLGTGSFAFNGAKTTLQAGAAGLSLPNPITLTSAGTIDTDGNTLTLAVANALSGTNGLTITSTAAGGVLSLPNGNAGYTGSTTLAGGTVRIGNNSSLGTGSFAFNGASTTLQAGAAGLSLTNPIILTSAGTIDTNGNLFTLSANIMGAGDFTKSGTGTLTLSGTPSYTGSTTINGGALIFQGDTSGLAGNITNNAALVFDQAANSSFSKIISGTGTLTKSSAGILTLSGAPTYSGLTTIDGGTLTFQGDTSGLAGNITNNAALVFDQAANSSFSKIISGTGTLYKTNTGTLTLSGTNDYTGATTIDNGILEGILGSTTALTLTSPGEYHLTTDQTIGSLAEPVGGGAGPVLLSDLLSPFTLTTGGNNASTSYDGILSGIGGLTKVGTGTFTLSGNNGNNTYSGPTTINTGTLAGSIPTTTALIVNGGGTYDLNGSDRTVASLAGAGNGVVSLGNFTLSVVLVNSDASYEGTLTGGKGGLIKEGKKTLSFLSNNNSSYLGGTTINAGTLAISRDGNLGGSSGSVIFGGGILQFLSAGFSSARNVFLNLLGGTVDTNGFDATLSGPMSGPGDFVKTGMGMLTLTGTNSYDGTTHITDGTLAGGLPSNTALTIDAGAFYDLNASDREIGSLEGDGTVNLGGSTLRTGRNDLDKTFSGAIEGAGGLTKTGAGTFTLSGTNRYTGLTEISSGALTLTGSLSGPITGDAGSIFNISGVILSANNSLTNSGLTNFIGTASADTTTISNNVGGVIDISGTNKGASIGSLSGAGNVSLGTKTLTLGGLGSVDEINGVISDTGNLIKEGAGTLTFKIIQAYTGFTTVNGGILAGLLPSTTRLIVNVLGKYNLTADQAIGSLEGSGPVDLGAFKLTAGNNTDTSYSGILSGSGGLTKVGSSTFTLSGANNYTGPTLVSAGILKGTLPGTFPFLTDLTVDGGEYDLTADQTLKSLAGSGPVKLSSFTLTTDGNSTSTPYSGPISGTGGFIKSGAGTLTFTGNNTYSGPTSVNGGTLAGNLPTGTPLTVSVGATYSLNGADRLIGPLQGDGIVDLGAFSLTTGSDNTPTLYSGILQGDGGLVKIGEKTFTLSGANTYKGPTTVTVGVLAGTLSTSTALTVNAGGEYDLTKNQTIGSLTGSGPIKLQGFTLTVGDVTSTDLTSTLYSGILSGNGGLTKVGTKPLILSGASTFIGLTTINSGATLTLTGSLAGAVTVNSGAIFNVSSSTLPANKTVTNNGTVNFTGPAIADNATILNNGGGVIDISGVTTPSIAIGSLSGAGNVLLGAKTLVLGGLNNALDTISGVISGIGGGLTKIGSQGVLKLLTTPTYTGSTSINEGTLQGPLPASTLLTIGNSGLYDLTANQTLGALQGSGLINLNTFTLTTNGNNTPNTIYSGDISGAGGLIKEGTGVLTLLGNNTYTGPTLINGGSIAGVLPTNTAVTVSAGDEFILTKSQTIGSLDGAGHVNLNTFSLTTGGNNLPTTFSGVLSGTGGLTKDGTDIFTLSGVNTYAGTTTINRGVLNLTGSLNGPVTVNAGSTFNPSGVTLSANNSLTNNGTTNFTGASTAADASIINNGGGVVDISSTSAGINIGSLSGEGSVILGGKPLTLGGLNKPDTIGGIISGAGGSLTKIGAETLKLTTMPTYTGLTLISSGAIEGLLPTTTALNVDKNGQYMLTANQTLGSLAGSGSVSLGQFSLTTGGDNTPTFYSGVLSGTGNLTKTGNSTFELAGANIYTGSTIVNSGVLTLTGSLKGAIFVSLGSTFNISDATLSANNSLRNDGRTNFIGSSAADSATIINNLRGVIDISGASSGVSIGSLSGEGDIALGGNTLTLGSLNKSDTIIGIISGSGGLTKTGTGNLTLAKTPTYAGPTTIDAGSLAGPLPTNTPLFLNNQGEYFLTADQTIGSLSSASASIIQLGSFFQPYILTIGGNNIPTTYTGTLMGTGGIIKTGNSSLTLTGANIYTGPTTINGGTLTGLLPPTTALTVNPGGTYNLTANQTLGSLLGSGPVNLSSFTLTTDGSSMPYSGTISGAGGLVKSGSGTLTLTGSNIYSGPTSINGGTLAGNLPKNTTLRVNKGGEYDLTSNQTIASLSGEGLVKLSTFTLTVGGEGSYEGVLSGAGGLIKEGAGTLTLSGANSYSGTTRVNEGTLAGTLPITTALSIEQGATYVLTTDQTIGSLSGSGSVQLSNLFSPFILSVGRNGNSTSFSGNLTGTGGLIKEGTGTLTIFGANSYLGPTRVDGGILEGILPSTTALTVNTNGTYSLTANQKIGTLAGIGKVNLDTFNLSIESDNTSTAFSGILLGAGGIIKAGTGALALSGDNQYEGGTTLAGGTLAINSDKNLGSSNGSLTFNGGTLQILADAFSSNRSVFLQSQGGKIDTKGHDSTFSGFMSGPGSLEKVGPGNLTLTGLNSYTGGITISGGALTGNTTSLAGDILNNASLIFDQATNSIFGGNITGSGILTKTNVGNLTLEGINTYTGGTVVSAGTLTGNSVSLSGNIVNNSALVFNQSTTGIFAGNISGNGSLLKDGEGILFCTGDYQNLTGLVTIRSGEIEFQTVNVPKNYNLEEDGVLDFSAPEEKTINFDGTITGKGQVEMEGKGTVSFPNTNTYSGKTSVNTGTFSLDGSLPFSSLTLGSEAKLVGNGSALRGDLAGLISPGHSIGTFTFVNDFTMTPTATYQAEIGLEGRSDLIRVGTLATLDGTLNLVSEDPLRKLKDQTYTIVTAGQGIVGTFANTISSDRIKYTVNYLANAVKIITGNVQDFSDAFSPNDTSNSAMMARYLDTIEDSDTASEDLESVFQVLDTYLSENDTPGLTAALDQMQPSLFREFGFLSFNHNTVVNKALHSQQQYLRDIKAMTTELNRLKNVNPARLTDLNKVTKSPSLRDVAFQEISAGGNLFAQGNNSSRRGVGLGFAMNATGTSNHPSPLSSTQRIQAGRSTLWVQSYGQLRKKDHSTNGNVGLTNKTGGMALGADYRLTKNTILGVLAGYSTTLFNWQKSRGWGSMNSGYGGIYGSWVSENGLYVDGQIIAGIDRIKSKRKISFKSVNRLAQASHNAFEFSTNAEIGYALCLAPLTIQPFLNVTYMATHERGYQESGANSLNLQVKPKTSQFLRGEFGTTVYQTFMINDVLVRPSLQAAWIQKRPLGNHQNKINGGVVNQPATLTVFGDNRIRNQFTSGISLTTQFKEGFYITGSVNGEAGSGEKSGEALLTLGYQF